MPEIKLTEEELKIVFLIKKKQLSHKDTEGFLNMFCFLLDNDFFVCKGGKKIAFLMEMGNYDK